MDKEKIINKVFTPEIREKADALLAKYETKRAPILMILRLLQNHYGYVSEESQKAVAYYLELPEIDVVEVMTFYTLFHDEPRAKTEFHVCRTLACNLFGATNIVKCFEEKLGIKSGCKTADGEFSLDEVECLGACEIAPMLQINGGEYVGKLTPAKVDQLIADAKSGKIEPLKKGTKTAVTLHEEK